MKLRILHDAEMVKAPIIESPGFAKKGLSDYHIDLARRCAASCAYCSTNSGYPARTNRARLTALAKEQLLEDIDPTREPGVSIAWDADEVMRRLDVQLAGKSSAWGAGKTLMVSQLTDPFFGYPLSSGLTRRALDAVLARTSFRIRILTKCDVVGREPWLSYFHEHRRRVVVGLSVGTLDETWASKVELATSKPTARLAALHRLQEVGVPTFGMLCPIFPDAAMSADLEKLVTAINPTVCEHVWAEPYNDRDNWRACRAGYAEGTKWWEWFTTAYAHDHGPKAGAAVWSRYATGLYRRLRDLATAGGWLNRLRYLLYEDQIAECDAPTFAGLDGVLLQTKPIDKAKHGDAPEPRAGYSHNPYIAVLQRSPRHGRVEAA